MLRNTHGVAPSTMADQVNRMLGIPFGVKARLTEIPPVPGMAMLRGMLLAVIYTAAFDLGNQFTSTIMETANGPDVGFKDGQRRRNLRAGSPVRHRQFAGTPAE